MKFLEKVLSDETLKELKEKLGEDLVGYSGGKDSEVLVDLFIRSGVKFIVIHNHTGLDAPETVYHIRKQFKKWQEIGIDCRIYYPKKTFWQLCKEKKMLSTRTIRFCCEELKERNDIPELKFATHAFGVRKTEGTKRAQHRDSIETRNTESFGTKSHQMFHFDKAEEVRQTSACYANKYMLSGVNLKDMVRLYGRDFVYHYSQIKLLVKDIILQEQNEKYMEEEFAKKHNMKEIKGLEQLEFDNIF